MGKKKSTKRVVKKRALKPVKKKVSTKKSSAKKAPVKKKATPKKKAKANRAFEDAASAVQAELGSRPSDVLGGRFPLYAYRTDKEKIAGQLESLRSKPELDSLLVVEGYYRSPAIFLLSFDDQFRFFFADRKVSKWIKEKGEEFGLRLASIQIGKFFYTPKLELDKESTRQLRAESKELFGLDNPISVSSNRITVRYG